MPGNWSNHSKDNHSINMSIFYWNHVKTKNVTWNMSKQRFSLICICLYMDRICDSVHIWENTDMILIDGKIKIILLKVKRRSALQLTLSSLELCRILEAVLRKVTTSGVPLIVVTTIWFFNQSSNLFFNHWGSNVDAWSEVNSTLSVAYSGPCQTSKMQLFAKNT